MTDLIHTWDDLRQTYESLICAEKIKIVSSGQTWTVHTNICISWAPVGAIKNILSKSLILDLTNCDYYYRPLSATKAIRELGWFVKTASSENVGMKVAPSSSRRYEPSLCHQHWLLQSSGVDNLITITFDFIGQFPILLLKDHLRTLCS